MPMARKYGMAEVEEMSSQGDVDPRTAMVVIRYSRRLPGALEPEGFRRLLGSGRSARTEALPNRRDPAGASVGELGGEARRHRDWATPRGRPCDRGIRRNQHR